MSFFVHETCDIYLKLVYCIPGNNMFRLHRFELEYKNIQTDTVRVTSGYAKIKSESFSDSDSDSENFYDELS